MRRLSLSKQETSASMAERRRKSVAAFPRPRIKDDQHSLPIALLRAREAVMTYFRPHHRRGGITEQQWRVIRTLYLGGEMDATSLAERSFLLAPSLSRILKDLETGGDIRRRVSPDDSRQSLLSLSPKATAMVDRVAPLLDRIQRDIARRFGTDRYHALLALLNELEVALQVDEEREKKAGRP
jgi:homoprotocatechuate degradation regulator HpaR